MFPCMDFLKYALHLPWFRSNTNVLCHETCNFKASTVRFHCKIGLHSVSRRARRDTNCSEFYGVPPWWGAWGACLGAVFRQTLTFSSIGIVWFLRKWCELSLQIKVSRSLTESHKKHLLQRVLRCAHKLSAGGGLCAAFKSNANAYLHGKKFSF